MVSRKNVIYLFCPKVKQVVYATKVQLKRTTRVIARDLKNPHSDFV
jgi:hypothetical protein